MRSASLRNEFRGVLFASALLFAALLILVDLDAGVPGQPLLQSLRFHLVGAMAVTVLLLGASGGVGRAVALAVLPVLSFFHGIGIVDGQQHNRAKLDPVRPIASLQILSFNVLGSNYSNGAALADMIAGSGADVAIIMEADPVQPYLAQLQAFYPFRAGCSDDAPCDLMLLSRLPLENVKIGSLSNLSVNRVMRASVSIDGKQLTIVPVHLTKPYFDGAAAFEIDALIRVLRDVSGPLVVAGDFNAAAWSNDVSHLIDKAGLLVGPDYPATWPPILGYLAVPIDNIFTRSSALIEDVKAIPETHGSNHRALLASIALLSEQ